jgi:hypothetical protein
MVDRGFCFWRKSYKEASQTRDYWAGKSAALRAARPDPSPSKKRLAPG